MSGVKRDKYLSLIIFLFALVFSIFFNIYSGMNQTFSNDNEQHYYEMSMHYKNKTLPYLGARLTTNGKLISENRTAQVPGGAFYIYYGLLYKIAGENVYTAVILQTALFLAALGLFLFFIYRNFGFLTMSIVTAFIAVNSVFIQTATSFSNPNQVLLLSFFLFIFFCQYVRGEKYSRISATLIFPITALMGQCHFAVYYSIVPTMIVYLLFRFKNTKKYLTYFALGIFISFLLYLPYLIFEIKNGFSNSLNMLNLADGVKLPLYKRFPQIYGVLIFITFTLNQFDIKSAMSYWGAVSPIVFFVIIVSHIIMVISLVLSVMYLKKSKIFKFENEKEDKLIREALTLYFLYIPCTILATMFLFGKGGSYVYLFSIYAFSFTLIIVLVKYIENSRKKNILLTVLIIFMFLHIPSVALNHAKQTRYNIGKKQRLTYDVIKKIESDTDENKVLYIEGRNIFRYAFKLFSYGKNMEINTNANTVYFIEENKSDKWYTDENTDNINRSKKGDGYRDITLYYWYSYANKDKEDTNTFFILDTQTDNLIYTNEAFKLYKRTR